MNFHLSSIFAAALLVASGSSVALAQNYDDDDIYYNPSKSKAKPKTEKPAQSTSVYVYDYPAADAYTPVPGSGVAIDVDTYNRRGVFAGADSSVTKAPQSDFNYTRKIQRFDNPDIIVESSDGDLASIYYSQPSTVNIYVDNTPTGYWGYP